MQISEAKNIFSDAFYHAWASARESLGSLAHPDTLDRLMMWRLYDPRYINRENRMKGVPMQRQWTIEARADFADEEKNKAITEAIRRAAAHVNATLLLLADGQKPQVVAFSDDFFSGHNEIALIEDTIGAGIEQHGEAIGGGEVSEEMLAAAREMSSK